MQINKLPGLSVLSPSHESPITHIRAYRSSFYLDQPNVKPAHCRDCKAELIPGLGIQRRAWSRSGFLCFSCFSAGLTVLTCVFGAGSNDAGFRLDPFFGILSACYLQKPQFSTPQIIEAVYRAMLDEAYTSIDILLGPEGPGIIQIGDIAEAII